MDLATTVEIPIREIMASAERRPTTEAFRHRRRNAWVIWTLGDVRARVEALATTFSQLQRVPRLVAVSGDYAPTLLLVALAAARAGARVAVLPAVLPPAAVVEWLRAAEPDLAFVGRREQVGIWRAALRQTSGTTAILADIHLPWGQPRLAGVLSVAELLGPPPAARAEAPAAPPVWIEEGTEWAEGLGYILQVVASSEQVLALPESRAAAARDRRVAQPVTFALSAAHYPQVQQDLAARLPTGRGLVARAVRGALAAAGERRAGILDRCLLARLRRPLGLARLREVTIVGAELPVRPPGADLFAALGITSGQVVPTEPAVAGRLAFA